MGGMDLEILGTWVLRHFDEAVFKESDGPSKSLVFKDYWHWAVFAQKPWYTHSAN